MKQVLVIHLNDVDREEAVEFLDTPFSSFSVAATAMSPVPQALIEEYDGKVDAIALDGIPIQLQLGTAHVGA